MGRYIQTDKDREREIMYMYMHTYITGMDIKCG